MLGWIYDRVPLQVCAKHLTFLISSSIRNVEAAVGCFFLPVAPHPVTYNPFLGVSASKTSARRMVSFIFQNTSVRFYREDLFSSPSDVQQESDETAACANRVVEGFQKPY